MLILLALPVIVAVAAFHRYLQIYAPSNLLVRRVRAQQPRWRDRIRTGRCRCVSYWL